MSEHLTVVDDDGYQTWLDDMSRPAAFYGDQSGLIHMSIDCAERLNCLYQNMGEYEPPSAMIDLTPENAKVLRDGLTKALAAHRRDIAKPDWA